MDAYAIRGININSPENYIKRFLMNNGGTERILTDLKDAANGLKNWQNWGDLPNGVKLVDVGNMKVPVYILPSAQSLYSI